MSTNSKLAYLFVFSLIYCCSNGAQAQQQQCPVSSSDISSLDLSQVNGACASLSNPPTATQCDMCAATLAGAFQPLVPGLQVNCANYNNAWGYVSAIVSELVDECASQALSGLSAAGVNVAPLISLQNCNRNASDPKIVAAVNKLCTNINS